MPQEIGHQFQQETKDHRDRTEGLKLDWSHKPELYKTHPGSEKVDLPPPGAHEEASLDHVLRTRRSVREFAADPITMTELSYLLWASTGIRRAEEGYEFRTAPSAGALYPIETYLVANNVAGLEEGVYHYSIKEHLLEKLTTGRVAGRIGEAALGQGMCARAPVVFVWTAVFRRATWKYRQRGYRYIYLDAGHIAQNLALAAVALRLGSCEVGALFDDEVNDIVGVDGTRESVVCMCIVGRA